MQSDCCKNGLTASSTTSEVIMGLRIRTNVSSLVATRHLGETNGHLSTNLERLSSGYRINKSADDPAGLAIVDARRAQIRSLEKATGNANDGVSMLQIAEGGMNEISNILIRLRELATQAASDTIGNTERSYANREYVQLVEEVDRISKTVQFSDLKLLGGPDANNGVEEFVIHVGKGAGFEPNTDTITVSVQEMQLRVVENLSLGTGSEVGPLDPSETFDRSIAAAKLGTIDSALSYVASTRANIGAKQSRLLSAINALAIETENLNSANSRVRDVDFASETAKLAQNRILAQAGLAVLSQSNLMPEQALQLLR